MVNDYITLHENKSALQYSGAIRNDKKKICISLNILSFFKITFCLHLKQTSLINSRYREIKQFVDNTMQRYHNTTGVSINYKLRLQVGLSVVVGSWI